MQKRTECYKEHAAFKNVYLNNYDPKTGITIFGIAERTRQFGYGESAQTHTNLTDEEREQYLSDLKTFMEKYGNDFVFTASLESPTQKVSRDFKVAGISESYYSGFFMSETDFEKFKPLSDEIYINNTGGNYDEIATNYVRPRDAIYAAVFIPYDGTAKSTDSVVGIINKKQSDDSFTFLFNPISEALEGINSFVEYLSPVFLWAGIVLALFSALLLCNFISVSITYKKKEIGILRAVGARSFDVFKIFFSESFLITAICVTLSAIGGIVVCSVLNAKIGGLLSGVSIFVFGPLSVLMLLGVAFLTAVIATFLPVWHAAKKKPVDSIRAL